MQLLLKFASPVKVSLADASIVSPAKCLIGRNWEQEQSQCSWYWKLDPTGTRLIEPLRLQNPHCCFPKLSHISGGVWVRVCSGNHHLCHPWALPLSPWKLTGVVGASGGHCPTLSPKAGESVAEGEGQHHPGSALPAPTIPRTPSDAGHKPRPFQSCWLWYLLTALHNSKRELYKNISCCQLYLEPKVHFLSLQFNFVFPIVTSSHFNAAWTSLYWKIITMTDFVLLCETFHYRI